MSNSLVKTDVICVGHASYDLVFSIPHHPAEDEKLFADDLLGCGGGPAANAAVTIAKLGFKAAFAGYLGCDIYGDLHLQELDSAGVNCQFIQRDNSPTPLSTILVKPDGKRALLNYKGSTQALARNSIDFSKLKCKVILLDGHEPNISLDLLQRYPNHALPSVLDAGSLHDGTRLLMDKVSHLVCSEKFALQYAADEHLALARLAAIAPVVVITLGERGLIWQRGQESGSLSAPSIQAIDTTGAGDAFHGAFAAALSANMLWQETLRYASAAGAYCCTKIGARPGLPDQAQIQQVLSIWPD
jgi:sulfofructose kinase